MILTLIGMSCVGKTYWATRLAGLGFAALHCDDLILAQLQARTANAVASMEQAGAWMGLPYERRFRRREQVYMDCERAALEEALRTAAAHSRAGSRLIVDTGGSVIYAGDDLLQQLRQLSTVVYLAVTPEVHQQMLDAYLARPRALIWNGMFRPRPRERRRTTFARCYPELIQARERAYQASCDVRVEYAFHRQPDLAPEALLGAIQAAGPS